jgi:ABC-2 type transport system ATP-binding protein
MGAGAYVGRIGGLAVALGIGAAVFTGHGIASAGPPAPGSDGSSSGSTSDAAPNSTSPAAATKPAAVRPSAAHDASAKDEATTVPKSEPDSADAASDVGAGTTDEATTKPKRNRSKSASPATEHVDKPSADATPKDGHAKSRVTAQHEDPSPSKTTTQSAGTDPAPKPSATESAANATVSAADAMTPVAKAPVAEPPEQATPDSVESAATGMSEFVGSLVHSLTGHDPATPADPPLAWTVLAAARRESFGATAPALDEAAKPVTNALTIDAAPTATTLAVPDPTPVVAIPYVAPLQGLQYLPVVGPLLVNPIVTLIHQIPLIGDLLHPFVGYPTALGAPAGTPAPRDVKVVSFDGTQLYVHFFPTSKLSTDGTAPTILDGPGLALPGSTNYLTAKDEFLPNDVIGVDALLDAGYNVVTWDPRGEWNSGGQLEIDSPDFEGRDVSAIISWLATQPEVKLDHPEKLAALDPRIGMVGASYGGGVQLATAINDHRIDAIVPTIAWHSLNTSLYKDQAFKSSWGTLLTVALLATLARPNPALYPAAIIGDLTGMVSQANQDLLAARGPGDLVGQITAPTLLVQGTVDTLFTLQEADANAKALIANGVPTKVVWFCGGHGACVSTTNDGTMVIGATLDWLNRYVKQDDDVDTGPQFEWVDQRGTWYSSNTYPVANGDPVVASTSTGGTLPLVPFVGGSGPQPGVVALGPIQALLGIASGAKAANALNLTTPKSTTTTYVVGAPKLSFDYSGTGTASHVYAQLVDDTSGLVLGNLVTPIAVTLDGQSRTATVELEQVAQTLRPGETLTVQLVASALPYETINSFGVLNVSSMTLSLPTATGVTATL